MNITTSIRHPDKSPYITLHAWQVKFCKNNHCAALLLSYFSAWHDWKLRNDQYYRRSNDIAELHGDGRPNNENAYLFFATEELIDGCMGLYGKKAICDGLDLLVSLGVISVHKNPNPRYHFDKTRYFIFYSDVCNEWIEENYPLKAKQKKKAAQPIDSKEGAKTPDREDKKALPSRQNGRPSSESSRAITNTTNNTTNKNQSINVRDDFNDDFEKPESRKTIQPIVDALIEKGLPANKLYPDSLQTIQRLQQAGVTLQLFKAAYDIAVHSTQERGFGVNYLAKVAEGLLAKSKKRNSAPSKSTSSQQKDNFHDTVYESDVRNARNWLEGKK